MSTKPVRSLYCSFCAKSEHDVSQLIAGPAVYICDECVALCAEIIEETRNSASEREYRSWFA